ncbi:prepilin-type N-terminal cleavage/methylation domain-containing protein [Rubellicoccus peritrichatus]|uniref:Prepilin-type N-terminal cleavage/methylation domain-containing protein n=1 Tax=Rubellicoccus peritrichatus TaxID=3080537 RepID=A0AAQ3LCQ5_9BACT|nr:prepilin-type N-terminal cleavage/methylation domain-containing protein [Puniceicoccus sp. CR14]WOO43386.1 prepilin-type N-terminal cleavage/methylation domain-containing protein [Puniceicoccus sp. CR14]
MMNSKQKTFRQCLRRGFSMVELLAVIAIISVMAVLIGVALGGGNESVALGNAQRIASSIFQSARSVAVLKQTPTRVIIYGDNGSQTDPSKFLRYIGVVYDDPDTAAVDWVGVNAGTYLPEGVYFMPDSRPSSLVDATGGNMQSSNFNNSSSTDNISFPVRSGAAENFYYYEFDSNGMSENPGGTFVIHSGRKSGEDEVTVDNEFAVAGFAIRRIGGVTLFNDYEEIDALN